MTIYKLQDLCYAYSVADPVREMLFALQDRIDALEAQRKPLTDDELDVLAMDSDGTPNSHLEFARAIEAAHGFKEGM